MKMTANKTKKIQLQYRTRVPRIQFINMETYPGWLELPLTGTNFSGPKPVRSTKFLLFSYDTVFDINKTTNKITNKTTFMQSEMWS